MAFASLRACVLLLGIFAGLGCGSTLPRSGLSCPSGAFVETADDGDRGSREWCEIPSYKKDCSTYSGTCEVPGTSHGPWVHYDAQGRRDEMSNVDHGAISGTRTSWWPSGAPKQRNEWAASRRVGRETRWHENGTVEWQGAYADDRREGAWAGWFADGKPAWTGTFRAGVPIGEWAFWNPDGSLARVDRFDFDIPGVDTTVGYWQGKRHGRYVTWNNYTGAPQRLETHVLGVPVGTWLTFDENGVLQRAETYAQGVIVATWQRPT